MSEPSISTPAEGPPDAAAKAPRGRLGRSKRRVYRLLFPGDGDSKVVDSLIITLISLNVLGVIIESDQATAEKYADFFLVFETVSSLFFSLEYVLRVWVVDLDPRFKRPFLGRLRYAFTVMALVDLVAILPFFLQFIEMDTRIARAIRMFRLIRILKMGRYATAVATLSAVFARKKEELAIVTFVLVMLLILCSSMIYFVEGHANPDGFESIPASMWWSVVTITSVGYGDIAPITEGGKVVGGIICLIGVLFVALPTGILSAGFLEQMRERKLGDPNMVQFGYCPHCGEQLNPLEELE